MTKHQKLIVSPFWTEAERNKVVGYILIDLECIEIQRNTAQRLVRLGKDLAFRSAEYLEQHREDFAEYIESVNLAA